jgi:hypothetical protein
LLLQTVLKYGRPSRFKVRSRLVSSATAQHRRSFWLKQLHQWHWISAALSLIGMLLFAITGITLNHAGQIEAKPVVVSRKATLPPDLLAVLAKGPEEGKRPLPVQLEPWLDKAVGAEVAGREGDWSADRGLCRPGPSGRRRLGLDRPRDRRRRAREDHARRGLPAQRPAQGPQFRQGLELVHRHLRGGLRDLHGHRPDPAAVPRPRPAADLAAGRGWAWPRPSFSSSFSSTSEAETVKRSISLLTFAGAAIGAAPAMAADLNVTVEVPKLTVAEYHKPYVAIWIENPADASAAGTLAVWYDADSKEDKPSG